MREEKGSCGADCYPPQHLHFALLRLIQFVISFCLCEFSAQLLTPHPRHLATYSSGSFPPWRPLRYYSLLVSLFWSFFSNVRVAILTSTPLHFTSYPKPSALTRLADNARWLIMAADTRVALIHRVLQVYTNGLLTQRGVRV